MADVPGLVVTGASGRMGRVLVRLIAGAGDRVGELLEAQLVGAAGFVDSDCAHGED